MMPNFKHKIAYPDMKDDSLKMLPGMVLLIFLITIILVSAGSCKGRKAGSSQESFIIYGAGDSIAPGGSPSFLVAVPFDTIAISIKSSVEEKVTALLDSLSSICFNGLDIELMNINTDSSGIKTIRIDLREDKSYTGPGTTEPYFSWYDFFQGSTGGQSTTISLINTILQRNYEGEWPDALEVYYMGEPVGNMDHINLSGIILR